MPNDRYKLRKQRNSNRYFVVSEKTGRKFSKKALPKSRARRQQQALYASQRRSLRGGCSCSKQELYGGCCGCKRSLYGGKVSGGKVSAGCSCKGISGGCGCGGASPDYKRALALGAISGLVTQNRNVGLGVGLGSVGLDLLR